MNLTQILISLKTFAPKRLYEKLDPNNYAYTGPPQTIPPFLCQAVHIVSYELEILSPKKTKDGKAKKLRTDCPETVGKPAPPQLRPPLPSLPCRDLDRPLESRFPSNQCTLHSDQPVHISIEHPLNRCILHCTLASQPVHFTLCTLYNQCTMYRKQKRQSGDEHCLKEKIMPWILSLHECTKVALPGLIDAW